MMHGVTTSIRLPQKLRIELDEAAHSLHRGKNWIITRALEEYLSKLDLTKLAKEAKQQSILASKADKTDSENKLWEDNSDTSGWI